MADDKNNTDESEGSQLEGNWTNVLRTGSFGTDGDITSNDLDDMVNEYQARATNKAPVVLGRPSKTDRSPVGTVDEIRRKGDTLQAKLTNLDPRVEQLHGKGVFKKRSVMIGHNPKGAWLDAVGLVAPQWHGQHQRLDDELTPSLDDLYKQTFGTQSVIFGEPQHLVSNTGRIRVDPNSVRLSEAARKLTSEKSITFCEALSRVSTIEMSDGAWPTGKPRWAVPADPNSARLSKLAKQRASEKSITFSEALNEVAEEQPGLTRHGNNY